ncbi:unnamed protein product [Schistosoma curassoni]|uniref:DUF547 domain-containing protein n=1 Tax=Schistosoma curassoni TaxID=6186 RepID=A0A183K8M0_9TREM|nr:unnamed protein product [Schistosoma curassoni]
MDVQFHLHNSCSYAPKYSFVLGILPTEVVFEVPGSIGDVSAFEAYNQLNQAVIQRTSMLYECELSNKSPSQLLCYMKQLIGPYEVDDASLKKIWLQRFPTVVRRILCSSSQPLDSESLASMADMFYGTLRTDYITYFE